MYDIDATAYIHDYDDMLLMEPEDLKNWKFQGTSIDSVRSKRDAAAAIIRHVVSDIMGYGDDPSRAYDHFSPQTAVMFRLDRILVGSKNPPLPNYGFIRFSSMSTVNWHYVLWQAYGGKVMPFSYAKEALEHYKNTVIYNDQARRGSIDKTKTRISQNILSDITPQDMFSVTCEFFRYFVMEHVIPVMPRTRYGFTHDIYAFFSDEVTIKRMLDETRLDTIFSKQCLTYYDLLSNFLPTITRDERSLYRNMFNLVSVSQ